MSNADDRCAMVGCGSVRGSIIHAIGLKSYGSGHHAFVEGPGPYCKIPFGQLEPAPQPEPSGDEAAVREIAERWKIYGVPVNAISEAYAAGARAERVALTGIAKDRMSRCGHRAGTCRSCMEDGAMIELIARRGSEGA